MTEHCALCGERIKSHDHDIISNGYLFAHQSCASNHQHYCNETFCDCKILIRYYAVKQ